MSQVAKHPATQEAIRTVEEWKHWVTIQEIEDSYGDEVSRMVAIARNAVEKFKWHGEDAAVNYLLGKSPVQSEVQWL